MRLASQLEGGTGAAGATAAPVGAEEFARLMAGLGPFETTPHLAVAVSGGADSLCLTLLVQDWARAQGGRITALTFDHGLRPESAEEAAQVALWLQARGISHHLLCWTEPASGGNLAERARQARYAALENWCAQQGCLHLLLAHHQDDQAETVLGRLIRGSGLDGLAAMAAVMPGRWLRRLRPLLDIPKQRLMATLQACGQDWIEDPSNQKRTSQRTRLRDDLLPQLAAEGLDAARLGRTARHLHRAATALEQQRLDLMSRAAWFHPGGWAELDPRHLQTGSAEVGLRLLADVLRRCGGATHPPRFEALERLWQQIQAVMAEPDSAAAGQGALSGGEETAGQPLRQSKLAGCVLAGCRIMMRRGRLLIGREAAAVSCPQVWPEGRLRQGWDNRFDLIREDGATPPGEGAAVLLSAAQAGWHGRVRRLADGHRLDVPQALTATLPVLRLHDSGAILVPWLDRDGRFLRLLPEDKHLFTLEMENKAVRCIFVGPD